MVGAEAGPNAEKSQKQRKAEDLGVRVITENDFCRTAGIQPPEDLKQRSYGQRNLLSMYGHPNVAAASGAPAVGLREDHLRYLTKWGLIQPAVQTNADTYYTF